MPLNGKFQEKYGLTWKDMDNDARMQSIMSELFDLREAVDPFDKTCKKVEKHDIYFRIFGIVMMAILIPLAVAYIKAQLGV